MSVESDYLKYRGKCRQMSEALVMSDPTLTLVRGYYLCPVWGKQAHWWCRDSKGAVVDPTKDQFPSRGGGEYLEFDGRVECAECGAETTEDDAVPYGNYIFCSGVCACRFVGVS